LARGYDAMRAMLATVARIARPCKCVDLWSAVRDDGALRSELVRLGRDGLLDNVERRDIFVPAFNSYIDPQTNKRYGSVNLRSIDNATVTRIDDQSFTGYARQAFTRQKV
jgi:hypothetical protein